jgi:N-acetylglutamate synthase-like GNAT family acetyltransferase
MTDHEFAITVIDVDTGAHLRNALLRAVDAASSARPDGFHVGGYIGDTLVGVASIHPEAPPDGTPDPAWRLAGVAVEHGFRGHGLGLLLVERCLDHAAAAGGTLVWAGTSKTALGFFERLGFHTFGESGEGTTLVRRIIGATRRPWQRPAAE